MQKHIAVVGPQTEEDELGNLVAKGMSAALFEVAHQNYPMAAKIISMVKELGKKSGRPIGLLQDISNMTDPLDLEFGLKSGVDWVVVSDQNQGNAALSMGKKLGKITPVIYKNKLNTDMGGFESLMYRPEMEEADAKVLGCEENWVVYHTLKPNNKTFAIDSILDFANQVEAEAIIVSDLDMSKRLSKLRPEQKIIFATDNPAQAGVASIWWGVHPVLQDKDLYSRLRHSNLVTKGQRFIDAADSRHVNIQMMS
jgi:pyruvate kinase